MCEPWNRCKTALILSGAFLFAILLGCSAPSIGSSAQLGPDLPQAPAEPTGRIESPSNGLANRAREERVEWIGNSSATPDKKKNGTQAPEDPPQAKLKITLPQAIQMCFAQNFRLLAGAERVRHAEADLVTASLIPNPSLFADYQLIPLQHVDVHNQLGPNEADVLCSVPIDWLLFGKRLAAMQAARLAIDVSEADYADLYRLQVGRTVDAFMKC
jgi:outer membrane protein TolC